MVTEFTSKLKKNVNKVYFALIAAFFVLLLSALGCLYALSADIPYMIKAVFLVGALLFFKQLLDAFIVIIYLSRFAEQVIIHDEGVELLVVPGRKVFYANKGISSAALSKNTKSLFLKMMSSAANLVEIIINDRKFYLAIVDDDFERLKSHVV